MNDDDCNTEYLMTWLGVLGNGYILYFIKRSDGDGL